MVALITGPVSRYKECGVLCSWRMLVERATLISIMLLVIVFPVSAFAILEADVDNSGNITLEDSIISLQIISGINVIIPVYPLADVDGDKKIGLAEAIYALQCVARLRNNHAPVLSPIGNKTIDEGAMLDITLSATDEDNDPLTFSISPLPNGATFNATTKTFSWTPTYSQSGSYQVTFTADDGYGGTASETISIIVNNKNRAPVLEPIGNKAIDESSTLVFSISASDADGDAITYSTSTLPSGATFDAATKTFLWTPSYSQSGNYQVTFVANDGYGGVASELINIAVNNKNRAPVLALIGNRNVEENSTLTFIISATDADGDTITYSTSTLPSGATFNATTKTFSWTPTYSQSGTYAITFTADDRLGGIASETIYIIVINKNRAPILTTIGNKSIDENSTLTFILSASDPDGDAITYSTSTLPSGATFNATTRTFSWTPTYSQSGSYPTTFSANDGRGGSDSETITITVIDKIPVIDVTEYFPLHLYEWQDYISAGITSRTTNSGTKSIGGYTAIIRSSTGGGMEYYSSDQSGIRYYGEYSASTATEVIFNTPLLLMPNNSLVGASKVSTSRYSFVYLGNTYNVNVTATTKILSLEDVQTANRILKDCAKVSLKIDQYIVETGQSVPGDTVYYWFYKNVGSVKTVVGSKTQIISGSYVNGVQQTY
ncbi:MAG: putative Ig domain-containing protein [Parachlamydia sp.]|nr:putative Ig domain-containing protein [Parachlamydia sp.]